jgi:hypothetical protein
VAGEMLGSVKDLKRTNQIVGTENGRYLIGLGGIPVEIYLENY